MYIPLSFLFIQQIIIIILLCLTLLLSSSFSDKMNISGRKETLASSRSMEPSEQCSNNESNTALGFLVILHLFLCCYIRSKYDIKIKEKSIHNMKSFLKKLFQCQKHCGYYQTLCFLI